MHLVRDIILLNSLKTKFQVALSAITPLYGVEYFLNMDFFFPVTVLGLYFHGLIAESSIEVFDKDILCLSVPNEALTT